jgi:hypothetical protein
MFSLGVQFQKKKVSADEAFATAQQVGQHMATDLKLSAYAVQPIEPLSWMRNDGDQPAKRSR